MLRSLKGRVLLAGVSINDVSLTRWIHSSPVGVDPTRDVTPLQGSLLLLLFSDAAHLR